MPKLNLRTACRTVAYSTAAVTLLLVSSRLAIAYPENLSEAPQGWESAFGYFSSHSAQGYLGVDLRDIADEQVRILRLKNARGAEIIRVDHDGPAGKCGLREHDVILQLNGEVIQTQEQLRGLLRETAAGRNITLVISRDGAQQTVSTRLANRDDVEREAWQQHFTVPEPDPAPVAIDGSLTTGGGTQPGTPTTSVPKSSSGNGFLSGTVGSATSHTHSFIGSLISGSSYTGAMVETIGPQLAAFLGVEHGGVLVHSVDTNSPAATAGLQAGDVVLRANSAPITSTSHWMKVMHENKGKPVAVIVLREKKEQILTLTPDAKRRSSVEPQAAPLTPLAGYSLR